MKSKHALQVILANLQGELNDLLPAATNPWDTHDDRVGMAPPTVKNAHMLLRSVSDWLHKPTQLCTTDHMRGEVVHMMVDLETLGTKSNAVMLSLGVVCMNADYEILSRHEWTVDWEQSKCALKECSFDHSTFLWWLNQNEGARKRLREAKKLPLVQVLAAFVAIVPDWSSIQVWGNGAGFDNPILENAFQIMGQEPPWKFWNSRCYRTLKALYKGIPLPDNAGHAHAALDDAETQAKHLALIMQAM